MPKQHKLLTLSKLKKIQEQNRRALETQIKTFIQELQNLNLFYNALLDNLFSSLSLFLSHTTDTSFGLRGEHCSRKRSNNLINRCCLFQPKPLLHIIDARTKWFEVGLLTTRHLRSWVMLLKRIRFNLHERSDVIRGGRRICKLSSFHQRFPVHGNQACCSRVESLRGQRHRRKSQSHHPWTSLSSYLGSTINIARRSFCSSNLSQKHLLRSPKSFVVWDALQSDSKTINDMQSRSAWGSQRQHCSNTPTPNKGSAKCKNKHISSESCGQLSIFSERQWMLEEPGLVVGIGSHAVHINHRRSLKLLIHTESILLLNRSLMRVMNHKRMIMEFKVYLQEELGSSIRQTKSLARSTLTTLWCNTTQSSQ